MSDSTRVIIKFGELYPFFSLIWVEKLLLSVWISDETLLKVTLFDVAIVPSVTTLVSMKVHLLVFDM